MIEIVSRTPLWVWPLLILLLWVGVRDLRTRWVPHWQPAVLAIVFPILSAVTALTASVPAWMALAVLVGGLAVSGIVGWRIAPADAVTADSARRRISIPGSVYSLIIIVAIFAARYYFGYLFGRYPELRADATTNYLAIAVPAVLSGVLAGRNLHLLLAARRALAISDAKVAESPAV